VSFVTGSGTFFAFVSLLRSCLVGSDFGVAMARLQFDAINSLRQNICLMIKQFKLSNSLKGMAKSHLLTQTTKTNQQQKK